VDETFEARLKLFALNATELKADFHPLDSTEAACLKLHEMAEAEGWKKIGVHKGALVDMAIDALKLPVCRTDEHYDKRELEQCDAGVTECDALVAQTGSVLISSRSAGGRGLSVLPSHHVVLARRDQLIGDLPEAFALLKRKYGADYPSFISLITGPSRTGDIERILVLGAHGPKKLTILMC
jgi:L-lactate dehydrogenase complex protein LldG